MEEQGFDVTSYFYDSIELLITTGNVVLHSEFIRASEDEADYVAQFLAKEYANTKYGFPGQLPPFDPKAAIWAAKTVFTAAQLLMIRNISELDFPKLLAPYDGDMNDSAMLSCDMCLQFLPELIEQAEDIDTYDGLIPQLDLILAPWCYSGIGRRTVDVSKTPQHTELLDSHSMRILTVERIVKRGAQHSIPDEIRKIIKPYLEI